jgi:hypothetical protein
MASNRAGRIIRPRLRRDRARVGHQGTVVGARLVGRLRGMAREGRRAGRRRGMVKGRRMASRRMVVEGRRMASRRGMWGKGRRVGRRRVTQAVVHRAVNRRATPVAGLKAVLPKAAQADHRAAAATAEVEGMAAVAAAVHRISTADRAPMDIVATCSSVNRVPRPRRAAAVPETASARRRSRRRYPLQHGRRAVCSSIQSARLVNPSAARHELNSPTSRKPPCAAYTNLPMSG